MCKLQLLLTNKPGYRTAGAFMQMLRDGSKGNGHATGVFLATPTKYVRYKAVGDASDFVKEHKDVFTQLGKANAMLGHNRLATHGDAKNNINNHPHSLGDFTLIHNGVLTLKKEGKSVIERFKEENPEEEYSTCDSWELLCIFAQLYKENASDVKSLDARYKVSMTAALKCFSGSFSVFIHNKKNDTLYYVRESARPLYFKLSFSGDEWVIMGSTSDRDFPALGHKYHEIGIFSSLEKDPNRVEMEMKANENTFYKIDFSAKKEKSKIIEKIGTLEWENIVEVSSYRNAYGKGSAKKHVSKVKDYRDVFSSMRPKANYKRCEKFFSFSGKPKEFTAKQLKNNDSRLYELLKELDVDMQRLYFKSLEDFDIDLSGYRSYDVDTFARRLEKLDYVWENPQGNTNHKYLSVLGSTGVEEYNDDEIYEQFESSHKYINNLRNAGVKKNDNGGNGTLDDVFLANYGQNG